MATGRTWGRSARTRTHSDPWARTTSRSSSISAARRRRRSGAHGIAFLTPGVEDVVFCFLRFPSGKVAHMHLSWLDPHKMRRMTVVGDRKMAVFDDMELERKVTVYDKGPGQPADTYGEWQTRTGDISIPKVPNDEPLRLECGYFLDLAPVTASRRAPPGGPGGGARARAAPGFSSLIPARCEISRPAISTRGQGSGGEFEIGDYAVLGKQPVLGPRSTASATSFPHWSSARVDHLCRRGRLRGDAPRRSGHHWRPGVRAGALRGRSGRRHRARRLRRERHDDRRPDEGPSQRLH